jgi:ectoine hydroxylase-related dioxygenase (phytanoyl-CoA dioxygenase family)
MGLPTESSLTRALTADEIETFERDGVVKLSGIYPKQWVDALRDILDGVFAREVASGRETEAQGTSTDGARMDIVEYATAAKQQRSDIDISADGSAAAPMNGRSLVETDVSIWSEPMRDHNLNGPLPELVAGLTRSSKVNFYSDQLFMKEPGSRVRTPFHQDQPYFLLKGDKVAVCWVPVDRVDRENGAMAYVRGSHRWDKLFIPSDFVSRTESFPEFGDMSHQGLDQMPVIEGHEDEFDTVYFDVEPGDVIVHHWGTLHGSSGNVSANRVRRAASVRYAGDDCTYYQRPSSPEPFRNTTGLVNGDRLEKAERFPIVWPRSG